MKRGVLTICYLFLGAVVLFAHGDVHESINLLSKEINNNPDSAFLYLMRGELYNADEQYKRAIKDFKSSKRKGLKSNRLYIAFAKSYYKRKKYRKALWSLNWILKRQPEQARALRLKGKVLLGSKKYCEAIAPFNLIIETQKERLVENYLEAATACHQCKDAGSKTEAVLTLEKGIQDLGPLLVLYEKLKEYALSEQNYHVAVQHQTSIIKYAIRKEKPYYERALLYILNKETDQALKDLKTSQSLLNQLPIRFQKMPAMEELRQGITENLLLLNAK